MRDNIRRRSRSCARWWCSRTRWTSSCSRRSSRWRGWRRTRRSNVGGAACSPKQNHPVCTRCPTRWKTKVLFFPASQASHATRNQISSSSRIIPSNRKQRIGRSRKIDLRHPTVCAWKVHYKYISPLVSQTPPPSEHRLIPGFHIPEWDFESLKKAQSMTSLQR